MTEPSAYHPRAEQHRKSRAWLEAALSGPELVRFAWLTLWVSLRIATNSRVFEHPLSIAEANAAVSAWLAEPVAGVVEPGERHWDILSRLMRDGQTAGPLVMDAVLLRRSPSNTAQRYSRPIATSRASRR